MMPGRPSSRVLPGPPLRGQRVVLRSFTGEDITDTYLGWLNNPEVVRFSNQRFRHHTAESCRHYLESFRGSTNHFLAICDGSSGAMVGTLTVYHQPQHGTADVGILVGDPGSWGKGVGLDAFATVVRALEASGQVRKTTAGTLADNIGMVRILERCGFVLEAVRREQELLDGRPVDIVLYARFCHG